MFTCHWSDIGCRDADLVKNGWSLIPVDLIHMARYSMDRMLVWYMCNRNQQSRGCTECIHVGITYVYM